MGSITQSVSFGAVIQKYRKLHGLSQPELAAALGVARNTVTNWETGKNKPDIDLMLRLCGMLSIPVGELLGTGETGLPTGDERQLLNVYRRLSASGQRVAVRLISTLAEEEALTHAQTLRENYFILEVHSSPVAAGPGCAFNDEPPAYFFVRKSRYNARANAVVRVSGESMSPLYHDGDLLYLQYTDSVQDGEDAVCSTADGAVVKRVRDHQLFSLNTSLPYGRKSEDDHVRVIGRVLGVVEPGDLPEARDRQLLEELLADDVRAFRRAHEQNG